MGGTNETIERRNLEFREWVDFLKSVNDDLNELNVLAKNAHSLGGEDLDKFVVTLRVFISSKEPYIHNKTIKPKVKKITDTLFSPAFRADIKEKRASALNFQYRALTILLDEYEKVVICLSQNKVIPEITVQEEEKIDEDSLGASV